MSLILIKNGYNEQQICKRRSGIEYLFQEQPEAYKVKELDFKTEVDKTSTLFPEHRKPSLCCVNNTLDKALSKLGIFVYSYRTNPYQLNLNCIQ